MRTILIVLITLMLVGCSSADGSALTTFTPIPSFPPTSTVMAFPASIPIHPSTATSLARTPVVTYVATTILSRMRTGTSTSNSTTTPVNLRNTAYAYEVIKYTPRRMPSKSVARDPEAVIGPSDHRFVSLGGNGGEIDVRVGKLVNGVGSDLLVVECGKGCKYSGNPQDEPYEVFVWNNGMLRFLGNGLGTAEFDLDGAGVRSGEAIEIVRIVDRGMGSGDTPGADIDALIALQSFPPGYFPWRIAVVPTPTFTPTSTIAPMITVTLTPTVGVVVPTATQTVSPAPTPSPTATATVTSTPTPTLVPSPTPTRTPTPTPLVVSGFGMELKGETIRDLQMKPGDPAATLTVFIENGKESELSRILLLEFRPQRGDGRTELILQYEARNTYLQAGDVFQVPKGGILALVRIWVPPGASPGFLGDVSLRLLTRERVEVDRVRLIENSEIKESLSWTTRRIPPQFNEGTRVLTFFGQIKNDAPVAQTVVVRSSCSFVALGLKTLLDDREIDGVEIRISAQGSVFPEIQVKPAATVESPRCDFSIRRVLD